MSKPESKCRLRPLPVRVLGVVAGFLLLIGAARAGASTPGPDLSRLDLSGGLCMEIGCGEPGFAMQLARDGRFLVQMLDSDAERVAQARKAIEAQGLYGLVSVVRPGSSDKLPYAENLVDLAVVRDPPAGKGLPVELARVVCPGGVVLAKADRLSAADLRAAGFEGLDADAAGPGWVAARRPWPASMDEWTHPWHGADGNTVSQDTLVGPPRRVRWIAGPDQEISSMVSARGRNFYGGVWARDAFNGLPLWQRPIQPSPARGGFGFSLTRGSVSPIAVGDGLLAVDSGAVSLLDGLTGKPIRAYPEAGKPRTLLHSTGRLLAVNTGEVRALDVDSGRLLWKRSASDPRCTAVADQTVLWIEGAKGEKPRAVCLDMASGSFRWKQEQYDWLSLVRRIVAHGDVAAFEVSTLLDKKEGNAIHVLSAGDGKLLWSRPYVPGMTHMKQARAMFIGDTLWIMEHLQCVGLDPRTGEVKRKLRAGMCHCFPPVATLRFVFSGEMDLTDLTTGAVDACQITKAACSRDFGWVPANGLIYTAPKHCVCWPMLRGYTALAPESPHSKVRETVDARRFSLEKGDPLPPVRQASPLPRAGEGSGVRDWPCYRHDPWRSGATAAKLPDQLRTLWTATLGGLPDGTIAKDWRENPFVRGPITAPVSAGGLVYIARPDAHQVVALDLQTGNIRWRFTADGRVDTPPTIHRGLCLFGDRSGSVWCLRADNGRLVWRLRAAPSDEQIVAHGQVESPWPVPGSVLVVDDIAYFAAGRQPLADGGILLFAVEPASGAIRWVQRLDKLPMTDFYACVGHEFDNFDLLQQEGDCVAMSRWLFDRKTGRMVVKAQEPFVRLQDGPGIVVQRGLWTYAPRNIPRIDKAIESRPRPLAVFRESTLFGCLPDQQTIFRRDFDPAAVAKFDAKWMTGWAAGENFQKKKGDAWPVDRLSKDARWSVPLLRGAGSRIAAMSVAGDRLVVVGSQGGLNLLSLDDGSVKAHIDAPAPLWDGMAVASDRVLLATDDGRVVCLGK